MKKKFLSAVLSAMLCICLFIPPSTVNAVGEPMFSPAEYAAAKKIAGMEYDSVFAGMTENLAKKTSDVTVPYSDSLTKRAVDLMLKRAEEINSGSEKALEQGFFNAAMGRNFVLCEGRKGDRSVQIVDYGMAYYLEKGKITSVVLDSGEKLTRVHTTEECKNNLKSRKLRLAIDIPEKSQAYVHKFSYKNKSYTLEMFAEEGQGFIIDGEGALVGAYTPRTGFYMMKVSFSPDESIFVIPDIFTEVNSRWLEAKRLTGIEYDYRQADLKSEVLSLGSQKKNAEKISVNDSLTRKYLNSLYKIDPQKGNFCHIAYNDDEISIKARSGDKFLSFFGDRGYESPQLLVDGNKKYILYGEKKSKLPAGKADGKEINFDLHPFIANSVKELSVFTFDFNGSTYTYELAEKDGREEGFLFDSKGRIAAEKNNSGFFFIKSGASYAAPVINKVMKYKTVDSGYAEILKIGGVKYDKGLADMIKSYARKQGGESITYKKSLAGKNITEITTRCSAVEKKDKKALEKGYYITAYNDSMAEALGVKGNSAVWLCGDGDEYITGEGVYLNGKNAVSVNLSFKEKQTENDADTVNADLADLFGEFDGSDNGKRLTFRYKGKKYTLEIFGKGYLTDSSGKIAAVFTPDGKDIIFISCDLSPADKLFNVPEDYIPADNNPYERVLRKD